MSPGDAKKAVSAALSSFSTAEVARAARALDVADARWAPSRAYDDEAALAAAVIAGDKKLGPAARESMRARGLEYLAFLAPEKALEPALALVADDKWGWPALTAIANTPTDAALDALWTLSERSDHVGLRAIASLGFTKHPRSGERVMAAYLAAREDPAKAHLLSDYFSALGTLRFPPARALYVEAARPDNPDLQTAFHARAVLEEWALDDEKNAAPPPPAAPEARPAPGPADVTRALAALDASNVPVLDAIAHLVVDLPRAQLLELRAAVTRDAAFEALRLVEPLRSAILLEHFVAAPLSLAGSPAEALAIRLGALAIAPRYDPWLVACILTHAARDLLVLDRADEAATLARRALRFLPGDPFALAALRDAGFEAAGIGAYLRDAGYGKPIVHGAPSDEERAATPFTIDLHHLEPLTDEELARYVMFARFDVGSADTLRQPRRHAANLLRRGDFSGALVAMETCSGWETTNYDEACWLGAYTTPTDWTAMHALIEHVSETKEGAAALSASRKKGSPQDHSRAGREQAAHAGKPEELAPLLADFILSVRLAAMAAIPEHPLARRIRALAEELEAVIPGRALGAISRVGEEYVWVHGSSGDYSLDGARITYPRLGSRVDPAGVGGEFPPLLRPADSARSSCKACKLRIEKGDLRLMIPTSSLKRDDTYLHARCAVMGKWAEPLRQAIARDRHLHPELTAALAEVQPKRKR